MVQGATSKKDLESRPRVKGLISLIPKEPDLIANSPDLSNDLAPFLIRAANQANKDPDSDLDVPGLLFLLAISACQ